MTNTAPRGPLYITPPNRDGGGWSRAWQRKIGGRLYSFTAVVMPLTGDLRYFVRRLRPEYADAPQFDCGWERVHEIIVSGARPQTWRRSAPGVYTSGDIEIRRDNNASADNRWSLRRPGYQPLAFRLLKSAKAFANRHVSRHTADTLIDTLRQQYRAMAEGCTIGDAERTMGRSRAHGGPVLEYEFKANGERALLCREHGGAYGDLARIAPARRRPVAYTQQPQQQSAQADQPGEVHAVSPADPAAAACGEIAPGERTTEEPGFVTCRRCRAVGKPSAVIVSPDDYPAVTGALVTWLLIGGEVRLTPSGWVAKISPAVARMHPWAHSVQVIDAGLVDYAVTTQAVQRREAGTVTYLSLPQLRQNDPVTVTPKREGRQFDVVEVAGTGVETMVRVSPRKPLHLDDGLRWVSRTYVRHVAAKDVEPYADDEPTTLDAEALAAATAQIEQIRAWCTRHRLDESSAADADIRTAIDLDHAAAVIVDRHARLTGQSAADAERDLRARAEALDSETGPEQVTVDVNGKPVTFTLREYVTVGANPSLWRITRFTTRGGVTPAAYALLSSVDDEHVRTGAYVCDLRPEQARPTDGGLLARAAGRAAAAYRVLLTEHTTAVKAGNTARAAVLADALPLIRQNAVDLGIDVAEIERQVSSPTIADMLLPAMPEQYRSALTHLLAPHGFAAHTGVDAMVSSDANPDPFLIHDKTGLEIGVHHRHVRISYPAVHAGEGDGDIGTAWFDLAYGTSFETVADIAVGVTRRLMSSRKTTSSSRDTGPAVDVARALRSMARTIETNVGKVVETNPDALRELADKLDPQHRRPARPTRTMGAGNVADDDAESLVFADESGYAGGEGEIVDAGGYLACGCHGSQRDHSCPASRAN